MSDIEELLEQEKSFFNIESFIQFLLRRRKIIILTTSIIFSISFVNTIYSYIKNPIFKGSFSILIEDPIDNKQTINSFEERVAQNEYTYKIPTLIQYLKSELVLAPVANELGISHKSLSRRIEIVLDGIQPYVSRGILKVNLKGRNKIQNMITMEKLSQRYLEAASEQRQLKLRTGIDFLDSEVPLIEQKTSLLKRKIEEFRKNNNIIEPLTFAKNLESQKIAIDSKINNYQSNIRRLNFIKQDIALNQFKIDGFIEELSELGLNLISADKEIINKYILLESQLAEAKTKFRSTSKIIFNLKKRIENLYPEIQNKQLASIELAIKVNNEKINIEKKKLEEIRNKFKLQPNLLTEYQKLTTDIEIAENNFNSLITAKENFRLELAQKSLPWRIIESPMVFAQPVSPNVKEEIVKGLLLALFAGLGLSAIRELFDNVFHNENEIEESFKKLNIPLLGSIPFIESLENEADSDVSNFVVSESFRNLTTSIRFLSINDKESKVFLITSTKQSEGKTTISSLLAKTFADLGQKVLIVDADLRKPTVHKFFAKDNIIGLSNLITDPDLKNFEIINKSVYPNLDIICAGTRPPDPIFLFSSERMKTVCNDLKKLKYDLIIFDAPPSQGLADARLISEHCDLLLYIVGIENINKTDARKVIANFVNTTLPIGAIGNRRIKESLIYGKYGYGYGYGYYSKNLYGYYQNSTSPAETEKDLNENIIFNNKLKFLKDKILKNWKKFIKWIDF